MCYQFTPDQIEKFWSRVQKAGQDECWEWTGAANSYGYGSFYLGGKSPKRYMRAHRVAFIITFGWILDGPGWVVAHTCDNPSCVNPCHLFHTSQRNNIRDRNKKGRQDHGPNAPKWTPLPKRGKAIGSRCGRSRLTEDQVRVIRTEYQKGIRGKGMGSLATKYGVNKNAIEMIVKRKAWKHVP